MAVVSTTWCSPSRMSVVVSTDVSMEVAVRVRFPLDEEIQVASLWLCAKDRQPVVDGVVEFGSAFDMCPFEVVKVESGNWAGW